MKRVPFCSRRLRKEDILCIQQWLREPHVRPWWRESEWSRRQLSDHFLSQSKTKRYIIQASEHKRPIGYAQVYPVDGEHEYAAYRSPYGATVGVDLFIGDPSYVGKGLGEPFLAHVVREHCAHAQRVLVDPDIENVPIMRVCEKYGFIRVAQVQAGRHTHAVFAVHLRTSVRAVIVHPDNEVLLMKLHPPQRGMFWCTIGGRIEARETHMQALKREIAQETGFCDYSVGRLLGVDEHTFFQDTIATRCIAWFYEVHTCQREVTWDGLTADEQDIVQAYAWWPAEVLCASRATVYPTDLCQLMRIDWSHSRFPVLLHM